jgi:hypothetical protein
VGAGVLLVGIIGVLSVGCPGGSSSGTSGGPTKSTTAEASEQKCTDFLQSVLDIFQLNKLGVSAQVSDGVRLLNQWQRDCGQRVSNRMDGSDLAPVAFPALDGSVAKSFSPEQLEQLKAERYSIQDGERLRDAVLFRKVSEFAVGSADNDLGRVVNVFDHVVCNVDLVLKHYEDLPLTPYECFTFGSGTAEDRAWILVSILRQLKIDAVVLTPPSDKSADTAGGPLVVGVLLNDQVYLFEPRLGLPLRSVAGGAPTAASAANVATLAQMQSMPDLLKQFDVDPSKPSATSLDWLSSPAVAIVGDTSTFSSRMRQLQPQFSGARATVISDPLHDVDGAAGLLSRVAKAGAMHWKSDSLHLWPYPESQIVAYASLTDDQQGKLKGLKQVWDAPRVADPTSRTRKLLQARIAQLGGNYNDAIGAYTLVRVSGRAVSGQPISGIDQFVNNQASDHAFFWKGICQFENGDVKEAKDTFEKYLTQSKPGLWQAASRYQLARSQAATGDFAAAIATLEATPENDHRRVGHLLLAREWRQRLKK